MANTTKQSKPTHAKTMAAHIAAHGPSTRKQLLAACGLPAHYLPSYFATVKGGTSPYYTAADYERKRKASLVASGFLVAVGKQGREVVYGLGSNLSRLA